MRNRNLVFWGIVLTLVGVLLLLGNLGFLGGMSLAWLWPLALIAVGAWVLLCKPTLRWPATAGGGSRMEQPALNAEIKEIGPHYMALRTIGIIYGILGWLTLAVGVLAGLLLGILSAGRGDETFLTVVMFIGPSLLGTILALPMLAAQDIIRLAVALEMNSRKTNSLLSKLVPEQKL
jgi:hypothetical protein